MLKHRAWPVNDMDPARRPSRYFVCCLLLNRDRSGYARTSAHDRGETGETATSMKRILLVEFGPEYGTGAPEATASFMKVVEPHVPVHVLRTQGSDCLRYGSAAIWIACDVGLDGRPPGRISVLVLELTRSTRLILRAEHRHLLTPQSSQS